MKLKDMPIRFRELKKELRIVKKRNVITINEFFNMDFESRGEFIYAFAEENKLKIILSPQSDYKCIGFRIENYDFIVCGWEHYATKVYSIDFKIIKRENELCIK